MINNHKDFPALNSNELAHTVNELTQYGLAHGLIMYPKGFKPYEADLAPFTVFPSPFPRNQFEKAKKICTAYGTLYSRIVTDRNWLEDIAKELSLSDPGFTGKLYQCLQDAEKKGISQPVGLALSRSDYMCDSVTHTIKQVEYNTISVSFASISRVVGSVHKFINDTGLYSKTGDQYYDKDELPVSNSPSGLAHGLASAVKYYEKKYHKKNTVVLFVVQKDERNAFDQRLIEYSLFENHGITSKRVILSSVVSEVEVEAKTHTLSYKGHEVSVVYYRSGYTPTDYQTEQAWSGRTLLETTLAIKCPTLITQLSGTKKVQQLLTDRKVLDKFYPDGSEFKSELQSTFCKIYPLDNSAEGITARKLAFSKPEDFVLKPQREGGGNNIYKEDIPKFLKSIPESTWAGYVLMELIHPSLEKNIMIKDGKLATDGVVSELGIYCASLFNQETGEVFLNKYEGHLLRSKIASSNEGGVAAGYGCVDSLYLY